jgi:hypothetical protein
LKEFEKITCRLAVQVCIGYSPSGTARHRTFSIKGINPNARLTALAAFVREYVAPVLAFPVTKLTLVKKIRVSLDSQEKTTPNTADAPASHSGKSTVQGVSYRSGLRTWFSRFFKASASFVAFIGSLLNPPIRTDREPLRFLNCPRRARDQLCAFGNHISPVDSANATLLG